MKRKVAQIGPSTLMVSLPTKWVKEHNIKKGDELDVELSQKEITFSQGRKEIEEKEIMLDISDMNTFSLSRYLETLYLTNHSRITLTYKKEHIYSHRRKKFVSIKSKIKQLSNRTISMEIVSQTKNSTELRCFLLDKEKDLKKIEKRIFFLLKEAAGEFLESLDGKHHEFHPGHYDYHDNITKFITYYLRVLDQSEKGEEEKKFLFSLYLIVDKMLDKFRHVSEMVAEHGCSKKVATHLREIFDLIFAQFTALHKGNVPSELVEQRYKLVQKIHKTKYTLAEYRVIAEVKIFLDTINDFSRAIIVQEIAPA